MLALGAALALAALTPGLLQARPSPPAALASCALGLLAAWTFLGMLAAVTGDADRPVTLVVIPVAGAVSAALLEVALQHAAHSVPGARSLPGLPAMAARLVLLTYYYPALARIAALAWRCARRIPVRHIDLGMRAVATGAVAEIAVTAARSAEVTVAVSGGRVPWTAAVDAVQGAAVIAIIAGVTVTAWFPVAASRWRQCRMWGAWWRLRPLWAAMVCAAPEVRLPPQPGTRLNALYQLHRRVIEIRDAELALRPYRDRQAAEKAAEAARSAGLPADRRDALVEAAVIATALGASRHDPPPRRDGSGAGHAGPVPGNGLDAETARLLLVSRAIRRSPVVRRLAAWRAAGGGQS